MVGGDAPGTVFLGGGETLAYAEGGGDLYVLQKGASGGNDAIVGFRPGLDQVALYGYSESEIGFAVASAQHGAYGSTVSFGDGTDLTLFNVQDVGRALA